ncbi:MAG TPA: hypothetical protein VK588_13345 [Chitinophagaceae bacterium]|nr:hypothetical protein [Chitinophagaceae bacterium]
MKGTYLKIIGVLSIPILLIAGCQKELKSTKTETPDPENAFFQNDHKQECRLVSNTSEFGDQTYTYNRRGLVDQWNVSDYGNLKMEYDARGRLIKSRLYTDGVLVNTIAFFYQGDRVVKETWYDGDTKNKEDEVFYFFNREGSVWKSQSIIQDYVSIYKYTSDGGGVKEWNFYIGGILNYAQQYTYLPPHHKEPNLARPGVDYDFISANGRISQQRWYSTSEKDISYDENGLNPQVLVDQDPYKSVVHANQHNYVTATDFFDNLTQDYIHFRFDYTNCGSDNSDHSQSNQKLSPVGVGKNNPIQFLRLGSKILLKEKIKQLRSQNANQ